MQKKQSLIALLLTLCMLVAVLSGCGSSSGNTDGAATTQSTSSADGGATAANVSNNPDDYDTVEDYLASQKVTGDDYTVRIGYAGGLCEGAVHMAKELGYFDLLGVNVEYIKIESGAGFAAVTGGTVDMSFSLLATLVEPLANGLDVKILTGVHTGCDKILVKPDSGITSAEDLKGKTVGITSYTASPYIFLRRVLADNGILVNDANSEVSFVVYSASDLPLALQNGAVDAVAMNDPTAYVAANEYNYDILFNSATDEPYCDQYCCAVFGGTSFVEDHTELARAVTIAIQEAAAYVQENPEETAQVQLDNDWVASGTAEDNAEVLKTFNFIPTAQGAYDAFGTVINDMLDLGMVEAENVNAEKPLENSFYFFDDLPYA